MAETNSSQSTSDLARGRSSVFVISVIVIVKMSGFQQCFRCKRCEGFGCKVKRFDPNEPLDMSETINKITTRNRFFQPGRITDSVYLARLRKDVTDLTAAADQLLDERDRRKAKIQEEMDKIKREEERRREAREERQKKRKAEEDLSGDITKMVRTGEVNQEELAQFLADQREKARLQKKKAEEEEELKRKNKLLEEQKQKEEEDKKKKEEEANTLADSLEDISLEKSKMPVQKKTYVAKSLLEDISLEKSKMPVQKKTYVAKSLLTNINKELEQLPTRKQTFRTPLEK